MEITKYANDALESVQQTGFLNEDDWSDMIKMQTELQDTFEKRQIWRTETEMRISVLNDLHFPTPASKYWQCVREQGVFFENLAALAFDYRRNDIKIKRIEKEIEVLKCDIEKTLSDTWKKELRLEEKQVDLEEARFKRTNMQVAAKDRVREIRLWSKIKDEMVTQDPNFDTKNVDSHQLISYAHSFANDAARVNENTPPADRINLEGKLLSAIRELELRGMLNPETVGVGYLEFVEKLGFIHRNEPEKKIENKNNVLNLIKE